MANSSESTGTRGAAQAAAQEAEYAAFNAKVFSELSHKGVEALVEIQKLMLDMATHQNAAAVDVTKHAFAMPNTIPNLAAVAQQGLEAFFGVQKSILDLTVKQSAVAAQAFQEQLEKSASTVQDVMKDAFKEASDRVLAAQRTIQDLAQKQNELAINMLKPMGFPAAAVRQGVGMAVEAQKEFVEAATRPLKTRAAGGGSPE